jgi:hypothetical protein
VGVALRYMKRRRICLPVNETLLLEIGPHLESRGQCGGCFAIFSGISGAYRSM